MELIAAIRSAQPRSEAWRAGEFDATLQLLGAAGIDVEHEAEAGESWAILRQAKATVGFLWADAPLALVRRSSSGLWRRFPLVEVVLVESLQSPLVPVTEELVQIFPAFTRDLEELDERTPWLTAMDVAIGTM